MTTIAHATIVMERTYKAAPARVFQAWQDRKARERWMAPDETIQVKYEDTDFRPGGRDVARCIEADGAESLAAVYYLDIRRDQRIVFTEAVAMNNANVSAALISVELAPADAGTHQRVTLQVASFDDSGMEKGYEHGWGMALDNLAKEFA